MSLEDILSPKIIKTIENTGERVLLLVALFLLMLHFNIFNLKEIVPTYVVIILWAYLIFNIGTVNVIKLWRNKNNPDCPKCGKKLIERKEYDCIKCGKIEFKK